MRQRRCSPWFWVWARLLAIAFLTGVVLPVQAALRPGERWLDTEGKPIQAHGGGVLVRSNVFYWYGEDRTPSTSAAVSCYSSTNLQDWVNEGPALLRSSLPRAGGRSTFVERPKVIYNAGTGKYVMWMHLEQRGYNYARGGIAISASPTEPFQFLDAIRPITNDFAFRADDPNRQKEFGGTLRDMTLYLDDDGKGYVIYASEDNWTLYIVRLNAEFTGPELPAVEGKTWARVLIRRMREAPTLFKHQGRYYLVTSGCTGWKPNQADYATAKQILGPYESQGNPCTGPEAEITFGAQSTWVLPAPTQPGAFIFMADRWKPQDLSDSRYVWLSIQIKPDGKIEIPWDADGPGLK